MATLAQLENALEAAAKEGNVAAAREIAAEMKRMIQRVNPRAGAPVEPRIEGAKMAAQGVGTVEAMAIGAGRTLDKLGAGVQQIMQNPHNVPPFYNIYGEQLEPLQQSMREGQENLAQEQAEKDLTFSAGIRREAPIASAVGGALPYLAVPGSMGVIPAASTVGLLEAAQYGTPEERAVRGAMGFGSAALGGYAGKQLGGLLFPSGPAKLSETQRSALKAGENLGIRPRLSQVTGNQFAARMEDMAARTPGGAGIMDDIAQANAKAVNRAAARTIGENADELTPSVFAAASKRLGGIFEDIKNLPGRPIQFTKDVGTAADDILRQQGKMIPQQQDQNLISLAKQAKSLAANKGRIDGESYQLLRSGLSEASFDASGTNRALYGKLLESIDDAAQQSLKASGHGKLAEGLLTARPQYGALKTLERGLTAEGGNVSPARLAQTLRTKSPKTMREGGGGELFDIARYGESFKPLRQGSQTYERETASSVIDLLLKAPIAYTAAKATTSPLVTGYPSILAANPSLALAAQQAGLLTAPAVRAGSMGLLGSAYPLQ